jgi:hypothetical protein
MWDAGLGSTILRNWFGQRRPRGAAVPFEAPALRMARVCDDERDGLIAILRDFANNGTAYIVLWRSLPLMAPMTDHDMALHAAVAETNACTPEKVRSVVGDLALSGALGPEAKSREAARTETERGRFADVELLLILHLLTTCGADLTNLVADPARWRDKDAKAAVAAAAVAVGVKRKDIQPRIAELTALLAPVGLVGTDEVIQAGWLRVLRDEIEEFSQSLVPLSSASPQAGAQLQAIAESAGTVQLAGIVINMLDYSVLDIISTIRRWQTELPVLKQALARLALMLDEWPALIKSVHDVLRGPPDGIASALRGLRSVLTKLPDMAPATPDRGSQAGADTGAVSQVLAARLSPIWAMLHARRAVM